MDAERDTDGTMDAHEGDHTPADGAGTEWIGYNVLDSPMRDE